MQVEFRRTGRRLLLDILILRPDPPTDLESRTVRALVDTGASSTGIARNVARQLDLPSIGKEPISIAGGILQSERYLFRVGLPVRGSFAYIFDDITGFELIDNEAFGAVLGMDVLSRCDFHVSRNGLCTLLLA